MDPTVSKSLLSYAKHRECRKTSQKLLIMQGAFQRREASYPTTPYTSNGHLVTVMNMIDRCAISITRKGTRWKPEPRRLSSWP